MMMAKAIKNKYDFVVFFDAVNGDSGDGRIVGGAFTGDAEAGWGIISRELFERGVLKYVLNVKNDSAGYRIAAKGLSDDEVKAACIEEYKKFEKKKHKIDKAILAQRRMCKRYFDVRAFGDDSGGGDHRCRALQSTVLFGSAKSVGGACGAAYTLYRMNGSVSAVLAGKTGFDEIDLELLWQAVESMFDGGYIDTTCKMTLRGFIIFKHKSSLGNVPAHKLFELVNAERISANSPVSSYGDYKIFVDRAKIPVGVEICERRVGVPVAGTP